MAPARLSLLTDYDMPMFISAFDICFKGSGFMAFRYGMGRGSYKSLPNLHCPVDMWHDVDEMEV